MAETLPKQSNVILSFSTLYERSSEWILEAWHGC